jgi:hypothetical protein
MLRRGLKFLHTMGAIGLMGSMACLLVLLARLPPTSSLAQYAAMRAAMAEIAKWIFLPSLMLTLVAGLLSIAAVRAYQNAGWAFSKLISGVIMFEWGFTAIAGKMQPEADLAARALSSGENIAKLGSQLTAERNSILILLAVAAANVILGIWRPRLFPD